MKKKNAPQLSVIIPACDKWTLTRDCLISLREHTRNADYEVIVVDNGSGDDTATELAPLGQSLFGERFRRIRNEENRNFGPASNQGAREASAPLIFFLNNDTLLTPGWLPPLLAALGEANGPGAAGPLLLYPNGQVQHLGVALFLHRVRHLYRGYPRDHPLVNKKRTLRIMTAAALILPKDLFFACGAFCEEYRNGFEDVDLSLQISAQGHRLCCVHKSVVFHLESQTPGRFGHDRHNGELLRRRCPELLFSDLHLHILRDGLDPVLDDTLAVSILLTEADSARLSREARNNSLDWVRDTLAANPGWLLGARLLSKKAEYRDDLPQALHYASIAAGIQISFTTLNELLRLSLAVGDESSASASRAILADLAREYSGPRPAVALRHAEYLREAFNRGDSALIRILENKKKELEQNIIQVGQGLLPGAS